jgi:putative tryptophan/tyrosine transport system substrate-binding protein
MRRRSFIAGVIGSAVISPLAARAQQQAGKEPRIGYLQVTSPSDRPPLLDAFRQGLRELGWVEGQNVVIDFRYAEDRVDRLPDLAAELVRLKVDLIVSFGTQGVTAAKNATETIPIVMIAVRDPVGTGLIASLARPGGNVTGVNITFAVAGTVLQQLARDHKDSLFNWNIRRFLGKKGEVNAGLTETLEKEPNHFYYYNNGISAL